jgi:hypothetical protein
MTDFTSGLHDKPSTRLTPLEAVQFRRFSRSCEINTYLHDLAAESSFAQIEICGYSVLGQPITALHIAHPQVTKFSEPPLRVLLVGTQHGGSEAAGGEALMVIARQLLHDDLQPLLEHMQIYVVVNANPDGRDAGVSKNANDNNLNRDYVLLSQPESHALDKALARIRPHVVLDVHESAALKRKSLGLEGFMTEFQAQLDFANNPAVAQEIQAFCEQEIMTPLLARIEAGGLPAQRYIKEIGSTRQPLTHGGVTARVFRNKAGVCGALSFLLETRMDPRDGQYETFRNVKVRRSKQLYCIRHFLAHIVSLKSSILDIIELHSPQLSLSQCVLNADFVEHPQEPVTRLPLRRIDTHEIVDIEFVNHRHIRLHAPIHRPSFYYITEHTSLLAHMLARHSIEFERIQAADQVNAVALRFTALGPSVDDNVEIDTCPIQLQLNAGVLRVSVSQVRGQLLLQLLEPQSTSSFFRYERFHALCRLGEPFFIYRGYA